MASFYTNIFSRGEKVFVRGYNNGKLFEITEKYKPYLFVPKQNGKYSTIDGKDVDKITFDSMPEAREFLEKYKDVSNFEVYGLNNFSYLYIYDNYTNLKYDPELISIVSIDIECRSDESFPDIQLANKEITAITIRKNGKSYVFGCGDFTTKDPNIMYIKCSDEKTLLAKFLEVWNFKTVKPDIITGWNIDFFDVPYLINRLKLILGEKEAKRISPWGMIDEKKTFFKGKENQTYIIHGISTLDYFQLYRKFKFGNQESYTLNYIAQVELGKEKLDYSEYGNLEKLYKNNFQKFIEYNILDTVLVDELEEKLGFIKLVIEFAYDAKVNFADVFTTIRPWDILIHSYLLDRRIVIPQSTKHTMEKELVGGFVKEPRIGLSKWIVSFDLTSLYPHLISHYNISPEVFEGKLDPFDSINDLLKDGIDFTRNQSTTDVAVAANGCMYSKQKQGFFPALMEKMFNDRSVYKKKMIAAKKKLELIENEIKNRSISTK